MASVSQRLAAWNCAVGYDDLPAELVASVKRRLLDTIGCALAAGRGAFAESVCTGARALGGAGDAVIVGQAARTRPAAAALANGALASCLSYDDTHNATIVHVSAPLLAVALALARPDDDDGRSLIAAFAAGSEITCRIAGAAPGPLHRDGFHPTGIFGTLGAAFVAARVFGLDAARTADAAGIAGSFASGIGQGLGEGSASPFLHAGWAAHGGIAAAVMAERGCTGPAGVIEGPQGVLASHVHQTGAAFDVDGITDGLGARWESLTISLKCYPCAHVLHSYIDALLALRADGLTAARVRRITCPVPESIVGIVCEPRARKIAPANALQGRGSLQYTLAEALLRGRIDAESYADRFLRDGEILALARRIDFVVDETPPPPGLFRGVVIVETVDGERLERTQPYNRGGADRPLSDAEIAGKFRDNAAASRAPDRADRIEAAVAALPGGGSVRALLEACAL